MSVLKFAGKVSGIPPLYRARMLFEYKDATIQDSTS